MMAVLTRPVEGKYQPRPSQFTASTRASMSNRGCQQQDSLVRNAATRGSQQLRRALLAYGAKHGLPNLSGLQCISELRTLCMVREEELALADRLEAEMNRPSLLKEGEW